MPPRPWIVPGMQDAIPISTASVARPRRGMGDASITALTVWAMTPGNGLGHPGQGVPG